MIHQLQEGGEGEGQHLPKAAGNKNKHFYLSGPVYRVKQVLGNKEAPRVHSLSAALHQTRECPDALHVDELGGEGGVGRQLGELFQGLQSRVDAVGLDPLQELTGSTSLSHGKQEGRARLRRPCPQTCWSTFVT